MVLHYGHFAIILKRDKNSTNAATVCTLMLRPTGPGIDKDRQDFTVELWRVNSPFSVLAGRTRVRK